MHISQICTNKATIWKQHGSIVTSRRVKKSVQTNDLNIGGPRGPCSYRSYLHRYRVFDHAICRGLASTLALLFTPVNSERAGAEHVGVAAASRSTPSSVLASAPGRLRLEAAAVQSERPHAAFQRQLLVVCALRQQRSSQSDSPRCLPEPRHSARVSQSQASQSPHQRASATRAVAPSFLPSVCFPAP
jgi:hypothetical protein